MLPNDKYAKLRTALSNVPCVSWTASRATVFIPETDDWAGKSLSIDGLDKQVARKLARYIADANPATVQLLLESHDALLGALDQLLTDMVIAQGNMRDAAKHDLRWEGCADAIQPRVDAARTAIAKATGEPT